MKRKITLIGLLIITSIVFLVFYPRKNNPQNQPIITENLNLNNETSSSLSNLTLTEKSDEFFDPRNELCDNYEEIQDFEEPISVVWEAKLTGCLESCKGAHFTRVPEKENYQYLRFAGYYPNEFGKYAWDDNGDAGSRIPENFLKDDLNLRIYGKWVSIDADHPFTVFEDKCVPILEIEKIEIIKK